MHSGNAWNEVSKIYPVTGAESLRRLVDAAIANRRGRRALLFTGRAGAGKSHVPCAGGQEKKPLRAKEAIGRASAWPATVFSTMTRGSLDPETTLN